MNFRSVPEDFFNPFYENVGKFILQLIMMIRQDPQPLDKSVGLILPGDYC